MPIHKPNEVLFAYSTEYKILPSLARARKIIFLPLASLGNKQIPDSGDEQHSAAANVLQRTSVPRHSFSEGWTSIELRPKSLP
jgi:hypothetical protein